MAAVAAATVSLSGGGAVAASRAAATPKLSLSFSKKGLAFSGPKTFAAGRVALSLKAVGKEGLIDVVKLKKGYSFAAFQADLVAFNASYGQTGPTKAGLKHLNHAVDHAALYGGLDSEAGQTLTATVVLPTAGTYYVYNDLAVPDQQTKLTVTGPAVVRAAPASSATVTALTADRFGGPAALPAKGTIAFKNVAAKSPHQIELFHVKAGTTRQQVLKYFLSGSNSAPPFARKGSAGTDFVSAGHTQTLTYSVPPGEYVEACFFPDLKTGIPHAFMGMLRIVHLK